jgi:hypothetical protein
VAIAFLGPGPHTRCFPQMPLSPGQSSRMSPFSFPLVEPFMNLSRKRLSDALHRKH